MHQRQYAKISFVVKYRKKEIEQLWQVRQAEHLGHTTLESYHQHMQGDLELQKTSEISEEDGRVKQEWEIGTMM